MLNSYKIQRVNWIESEAIKWFDAVKCHFSSISGPRLRSQLNLTETTLHATDHRTTESSQVALQSAEVVPPSNCWKSFHLGDTTATVVNIQRQMSRMVGRWRATGKKFGSCSRYLNSSTFEIRVIQVLDVAYCPLGVTLNRLIWLHSIALWMLYQKSFKLDSIGLSVWPPF